jgi:hypothetical protein
VTRTLTALLLGAALAVGGVSCAKPPAPEAPRSGLPPPGPVLHFAFEAIDGRRISAAGLANRISVIGFITSYDVPSQVQARFLDLIEHRHTPRLNVVALVLEAPENQPLVEAFAASLRLGYPIAMADAATIAGEGAFAGLHSVPSVVVLDRAGREAWRHVGLTNEGMLEAAVRAVEAASPPPSAQAGGQP